MSTLLYNRSRSPQGHDLYAHCSSLAIDASYQVFFEICPPVPEEKIFEGFFTIYGHGGQLGQVTWIIYEYIGYHFLLMFHIKFGFDCPSGFRGDDV